MTTLTSGTTKNRRLLWITFGLTFTYFCVELVAKDKSLTVHVSGRDDKPVDVKGAKATANVFSGKDKAMVTLATAAGNTMKGEAPFTISADAKIVLSFTLPGKKTEQARFSLGAKQEQKGHKH